MFGKILNQFPRQLQELDVSFCIEDMNSHRRCGCEISAFRGHPSEFGLRRLIQQRNVLLLLQEASSTRIR